MKDRSQEGWSLLELAIVITIIGILAALAIPAFQIILKKSRFSALANDLRQHNEAFQTYALENGDFPASHTVTGAFVPGLEETLSTKWREATPIGGGYTWIHTQQAQPDARECYIQLVETTSSPFAVTLSDVVDLDKTLDDGNLATGYVQVAGNRVRYYIKLADN